ncbi:MAG TPA: ADOP family duplicated permease [Myxococcales bacterium]
MALLDDVRAAARSLRRSPALCALAVSILALSMAGTTVLFGIVELTLLRPLPFAQEERLVRIHEGVAAPDGSVDAVNLRSAHVLALEGAVRSLEGVSAQSNRGLVLGAGAGAERVRGALLAPQALQVLGVTPEAGRAFDAEEERIGEPSQAALIGDSLARRLFGHASAALGKDVLLDGVTRHVVGVLPARYRFPWDAEVWLPQRIDPAAGSDYAVFARLGRGVSLAQARAELQSLAQRMPGEGSRYRLIADPLRKSLADGEERVAIALLGVVAAFLVLACVNVATLLLARSAARAKELAVRAALGASRARQVRQIFFETLFLSIGGALLGGWLALLLFPQALRLVPQNFTQQLGLSELKPDPLVLGFTFAVILAAALAAGLGPALQTGRIDLLTTLKDGGGAGRSRAARRPLQAMVVLQMALAFALLTGALAAVDGLRRAAGQNLGFDSRGLWLVRIELPEARYASAQKRVQFAADLQERARTVPGVLSAGVTTVDPVAGGTWSAPLIAFGEDESQAHSVNHRLIEPGLLSAMRIPLLRGRDFGPQDSAGTERVAIVSQRLAHRLWPGAEAIGQRLRVARAAREWATVVGVAGDVRDAGELKEAWYLPYAQNAESYAALSVDLMVRAEQFPEAALRSQVAALDGLLAIDEIATLDSLRDHELARPRFGAAAAALFALFGLLLAALGTYGVLSFAVAQETAEIGLRRALGATSAGVLRLVLGRAAAMALVGLSAGFALGFGLQHALASSLAEVQPGSPLLFALAAAALFSIAQVAALVPALRATSVAPSVALRAQ